MKKSIKQRQQKAHLFGNNANFIETLYENYLNGKVDNIPTEWQSFFTEIQEENATKDTAHQPIIEQLKTKKYNLANVSTDSLSHETAAKQAAVLKLINAYRVRGHQAAMLDPLQLTNRPEVADFNPAFHQLNPTDNNKIFNTGSLSAPDEMSLKDIISLLKNVYCRSVGAEYMHITDTEQRKWLQQRLEGDQGNFNLSQDNKVAILKDLIAAEGLEKYLHTKYVGQKRFSLEGGESLIPSLSFLIQHLGKKQVKEVVIGMAHRGRLNVLVNILGKSPTELFQEFEGTIGENNPAKSGDVKYHLGYSSDVPTDGGNVHLALAFNPSHLEIIDPVVIGSVRARQERRNDKRHEQVIPILLHGDAAFAGQGVIMETFNMSQARGFAVGGTIHIIINNQVGFTTSNPLDARSTLYCTEVAKMVQAPILHVNADDPEAVIYCTKLAADFRQQFKKDVVLDLVCYRRHGHNEADEPAATQPLMYQKIRNYNSIINLYQQQLIDQSIITSNEATQLITGYRDALDKGKKVANTTDNGEDDTFSVDWSRYNNGDWDQEAKTAITKKNVTQLAKILYQLPKNFTLHARVKKVIDDRKQMATGKIPLDWGFCELLAYASLLNENFSVRLVGQDSGRGTFFHRHAIIHNQDNGEVFSPLEKLHNKSVEFNVIDSLLSEEAVLGFEYGFATAEPKTLNIWEAQFGDFVNGAQVVIDQFISSGEAKWGRLCGLVMFLPHGYEGQGPEHSSARLERFLQLCAAYNMQVCVPTTPKQMFHMLRRQITRDYRKPLIVMTPKSLLRHKDSVSSLDELSNGKFEVVIPEINKVTNTKITRVVLCAGKVYFDLLKARNEQKLNNVAIIRIEQLYPFPKEHLIKEFNKYKQATDIIWCQEEPINQGAWYQIKHNLELCKTKKQKLFYAGRDRSPSPAVGYASIHQQQQQDLIKQALISNSNALQPE